MQVAHVARRPGRAFLLAFRVQLTWRGGNRRVGASPRELSNTSGTAQQLKTTITASKCVRSRNAPSSTDDDETSLLSTPPPEGNLSIVFTDIVKSTAIWESNAPAMTRAMQIHDSIIRMATTKHHGYEVKQNGDGFMIAFSSAIRALQFCLSVQQQLIATSWPPALLKLRPGERSTDEDGNVLFQGLRLRMSAHWGAPVCNWNDVIGRMDYLGPMVNRAARFIEVAEGGQIIVSEEFLRELQNAKVKSEDAAKPIDKETPFQKDRADSANQQSRRPSEDEKLGTLMDLKGLQSPEGERQQVLSDQQFEVRLLGKHQFKGITEPQNLYFIIPHSLRGRLEHWPKHYHVPGSKGNLISKPG